MSGALKVVNERAYKPTAVDKVVELRVRAMLDAVPGAWHEPQDVMEWIAQHSYVQDVELVQPTARQHDGTTVDAAAPDCAGRNGAHTPGPWKVGSASDYEDVWFSPIYAVEGKQQDIGSAVAWAIDVYKQNTPVEANARLIAAAPDMLEALRAIVSRSHNDPLGTSKVNDMRNLALAAIAKAEGR